MARPLRYEAAGAVYHVMARGDGGKTVFEEDKDRYGWVGGGTGKRLRSWRWSSFPAYAGSKSPEWLETGRGLRAFQLYEDHRGGRAYAGYLEARAKDAEGAVTDGALKELRKEWCLYPLASSRGDV
jgi:hypothetical protein